MSVTLYPGIRKLHLIYSPRYDVVRTDDLRDDLIGVKVWVSTTAGFNPTTVTPIEFAPGSSISIDDLEANTQYYVRYAFISRLDPNTYTVSAQKTAKTYDEFTRVYGELTNDPHYLAKNTTNNQPDWQYATGTFKVWNVSQEVTGNGPVYSIVSGSASNGLQVTINPTSGVFTATGWSGLGNSAKVTFRALYDGIEVLRDWNVVSGIGQDAAQIRLTLQPDNFIYRDATAVLADTNEVKVTANLTNLTDTPVFTVRAFRANGTEITSPTIQFTQTGNQITITKSQFHISSDIAYALVRAQIGLVYDEDTIFRLNNGTDTITIDVQNPVQQLQADENGVVDPAEYLDTGTTIEVYEGAEKLPVDISSPYANGTWRITNIVGTGIVAEDQPVYTQYSISFPEHANMTSDIAEIAYTVEWKTKAGASGQRVVKQKFAKSKQGISGVSAPLVSLRAERWAFIRPANQEATATLPAYIDVTAGVSNIVNPSYVWRIDGVVQAGETDNTLRVNKFTNTQSKVIRVEVSGVNTQQEAVSVFDEYTIYYVQEGSDALVASVTPESITVGCDSQGVPDIAQFPIVINTSVIRGITPILPAQITYTLTDLSGVVANINSTTGVINITDVTSAFASLKVNFTIGSTTVSRNISLIKTIDGASAPVVNITATGTSFIKLQNSDNYNTSSITLTATQINLVNPTYAWYVDGVIQSGQTNSTFVVSSFAPTSSKLIKCIVTSSTGFSAYDEFTVYSFQEGDDSYVAFLENENQTLQASANGTIYGGQLNLTSKMVVVRGGTVLNSGVVFSKPSETGMTSSIDPATGAILVTAFSATTSATATYRATITVGSSTITLEKTLTVTKARDGAAGTSPVIIDLANDNVTVATNNDGTGGNYANANTAVSIFSGLTDVMSGVTSIKVTPSNGVSYTYTKNTTTSGTQTTEQIVSNTPAFSSFSVAVVGIAGQDNGTLTVTVTYNAVEYRAIFTVSKAKAGANGEAATVYEIEPSSGITFNDNLASNKFSPSTVTYTAYSSTGTGARTPYVNANAKIRLEKSTNNSSWTAIDSDLVLGSGVSSRTLDTNTKLDITSKFLRATLLVDNAVADQETDVFTYSGQNAKGIDIDGVTNTSFILNGTTYTPASVTLTANPQNLVSPTYAWSISGGSFSSSSSVTTASTSSVTVYPTSTTITVTLTATAQSVPYTKTLIFSVVRDGVNTVTLTYTNNSVTVPVNNLGTATWTASGGDLQVYEGGTALTYIPNTGTVTAGKYKLSFSRLSGDTLTTPSISGDNTTTATLGAWSGTLTTATAYRITATGKRLNSDNFTATVDVTISPSRAGDDSTVYFISLSSPVIYKQAPDAATSGTHTTVTASGKKVVGSTISNFGFLTITGDGGDSEPLTASATPVNIAPTNAAGKTKYTVKLYDTAAKTTLLDTQEVLVVFRGATGETGQPGAPAKGIDISGATSVSFKKSGATYTPATTTLSAAPQNLVSPTYLWTISGGTFAGGVTSSTDSSVTITPNSSANVTITLQATAEGTSYTKTVVFSVVSDGIGQDGKRTATGYVYYYQANPTAPAAPTTTSVTYTFTTGVFSGGVFGGTTPTWSTSAPTFTASNANKYWVATYTAVENTAGGNTSTGSNISFGTVTQTIGFSGLVTFTGANSISDGGTQSLSFGLGGQTQIDGGSIITNTVTANQINSNGLLIRNHLGEVIFGAGNPLAWADIDPDYPANIDNSRIPISNSNLIPQPNTFTSPTFAYGTGSSFVSSGIEDPNGGFLASRIQLASGNGSNFGAAIGIVGLTSGKTYRASIYFKRQTAPNFCIVVTDNIAWNRGEGAVSTASGWNRLSVKINAGSNGQVNIHLGAHIQTGLAQQQAGTVDIAFIQLEETSFFENSNVNLPDLGYTGELDATRGAVAGVNLRDSNGRTVTDTRLLGNLLDSTRWVAGGTGTQPGFNENPVSAGGQNSIIYETLPDGSRGLVWRAVSGTRVNNENPEGGWNSEQFLIDHTKMYRFSVWMKYFGGSTGTMWFGPGYFSYTGVSLAEESFPNTNPYFNGAVGKAALPEGVWTLWVGYVFPSSYTGGQLNRSGVYRGDTGVKILNGSDYKWVSGTTFSTHRAYQYYTSQANNYQDFWNPRVELMDGTEPSLDALLAGGKAYAASLTAQWTGVSSRPTNLSSLTGTETIRNTDIGVNESTGAITGIGTGNNTSVANNTNTVIRDPGGGVFINGASTVTGSIKIKLPVTTAHPSMPLFYVDIYEYEAGFACTLQIGGHNWTDGNWYNVSALVVGASNVEYPVRFGRDSNGFFSVYIGDTNTSWSYPQVRVRDVLVGYGNQDVNLWSSNWSISFVNGFEYVSREVLDTKPGADWSKTTRRPTNLSNLTGTEAIRNTDITVNSDGVLTGTGTNGITVDNRQVLVGATNLLRNSGRFTNTNYWFDNGGGLVVDTSVQYGGYNTLKIPNSYNGIGTGPYRVQANAVYTISALVKASATITSAGYDSNLHIQNWTDEVPESVNPHQETPISADNTITTSWRVISQTFRTAGSATAGYVRFYFYPLATGVSVNIAWVKLELGNRPTDWTPNPEEITNTNVSITAGGALQGAGGGTVSLGGLGYEGDLYATRGAPTGTDVGGVLAQTVGAAATNYGLQVRSFYVPGSQTSFYPVLIYSSIVGGSAYYDFQIFRSNVHEDTLNLGSYTCHIYARPSAWGNAPGAIIEVAQSTGYGSYTYGVAAVNTGSASNGIWVLVRGGMTHSISMSQPIGPYTVTVYSTSQSESNGNSVPIITNGATSQLYPYLNRSYCPSAPIDWAISISGGGKPQDYANNTYIQSNAIQGVSSGAGTIVNNAVVTLSLSGTLTNGTGISGGSANLADMGAQDFAFIDAVTPSNSSQFIQNNSIRQSQIGGSILSTNFNGTIDGSDNITSLGTQGWAIGRSGTGVFHNLISRGKIYGGDTVVGQDLASGVHGLSLATSNFNNAMVIDNSGIVYFRLNYGGAKSVSYNSSSGELAINGGSLNTPIISAGTGSHTIALGQDIVSSGHYGLSLSKTDFNNIFLKRNDGHVFFRINYGGTNSLSFDTTTGILSVRGDVEASTIKANVITTTMIQPEQVTENRYFETYTNNIANYFYVSPNTAYIFIDYSLGTGSSDGSTKNNTSVRLDNFELRAPGASSNIIGKKIIVNPAVGWWGFDLARSNYSSSSIMSLTIVYFKR